MKYLSTTIAVVLLVGCATTQQPEPPAANAPDISIHDAAREGNIKAVKQHLANGTDLNAADVVDQTPLYCAVAWGHKEIVELLIAKGADVNTKDSDGETPLHWAAREGHKEVVELLIAEGADVNVNAERGVTPLHWVRNKETAEVLIEKGADVNARDDSGKTPLHEAAEGAYKEIVELLIANGADVNAIWVGKTALDRAVSFSSQKTNSGTTLPPARWKISPSPSQNHTEIADHLRKHGGKTGEELKAEGR